MTYWFILRLAIVYFIGVCMCELLKPAIYVTIQTDGNLSHLDNYTWAKSLSLLIQVFYLIETNLQQLLIILFYYRLD